MTREAENDRIPPQALALVMILYIVEINFLRTPKKLAMVAGHDSWLGILLAGIVMGVSAWLIFTLIRRFPDKTLVGILQTVFNRPVCIIVTFVYFFYWLTRAAGLLYIQSYLFSRQLLPTTPEWVLSLYMLALSAYLVRYGIEPMARLFILLVGFYLFPLLPIVFFSVRDIEPGMLTPILENGFAPVAAGAWVVYGSTPGTSILLMLGPFLTRFHGALQATLIGLAMVIIPGTLLNMILVMRFGAHNIMELNWPTISLVEVIAIPSFSGFRVDPIFFAIWTYLIFATIAFSQYLAASVLRQLFGFLTNFWPTWITTALLAVPMTLPLFPPDLIDWFQRISPWVALATTLVIPGLLLLIAHVRRLGEPPSERGKGPGHDPTA